MSFFDRYISLTLDSAGNVIYEFPHGIRVEMKGSPRGVEMHTCTEQLQDLDELRSLVHVPATDVAPIDRCVYVPVKYLPKDVRNLFELMGADEWLDASIDAVIFSPITETSLRFKNHMLWGRSNLFHGLALKIADSRHDLPKLLKGTVFVNLLVNPITHALGDKPLDLVDVAMIIAHEAEHRVDINNEAAFSANKRRGIITRPKGDMARGLTGHAHEYNAYLNQLYFLDAIAELVDRGLVDFPKEALEEKVDAAMNMLSHHRRPRAIANGIERFWERRNFGQEPVDNAGDPSLVRRVLGEVATTHYEFSRAIGRV